MSSSEKTKTISDIIKKWSLNSPSHGIGRIGRAKTLIASLFCGYIFWVFTILMGCFIYIVFMNYFAHTTKIHLTLSQHRDPKHFPAITFCNINPFKDDGFINDQRKAILPGKSDTAALTEAEYRESMSVYIERILADQVSQKHPFVQWGFTLDELMITCIFNKQVCNRNLTPFFHPNYGNCYTFDNDKHVENEINNGYRQGTNQNDNGEDEYKLFLELFLHQKEYNEYFERSAAFRIFIHQKNEVPILSENSLFVGPNKYTKLSFLPRVMSFTQQCQNNLTDDMKEIFLTHQVRYTQALCYKLCKHRFIVKNCQCIERRLAVFYQFFNNNATAMNISICPIDVQCPAAQHYFNSTKLCPECIPECENIQYSIQSSHAKYPNKKTYDKIYKRVRNYFRFDRNIHNYLTPNASDRGLSNFHTRLMNNIVGVEISASPYPTEIRTENSVNTWIDLISSIGGQTGLWIGVSLISFVEIIELLYLIINYIFFCKKNK